MFSSREPLGSPGELIVYPYSVVVVHHFQIVFETAWPIEAKLGVELPWIGGGEGRKNCSQNLGHITKMAVTPTHCKNPLKVFFGVRPISRELGL